MKATTRLLVVASLLVTSLLFDLAIAQDVTKEREATVKQTATSTPKNKQVLKVINEVSKSRTNKSTKATTTNTILSPSESTIEQASRSVPTALLQNNLVSNKDSAQIPNQKNLPPNSIALIPVVLTNMDLLWPDTKFRSVIGATIEQETCISLKNKFCWSPYAELKTSREYGFGLGQTTIAYNSNGSERFNVWKDLRKIDPVLKDKWTWDNRYDASLQIRALVIKSRSSYDAVRFPVKDMYNHLAFGLVTYNSGSVLVDRRLCSGHPGCDPSVWFGNVELYSSKSKVKQQGYGESFFEISRDYPKNILLIRRPKYIPSMDK